MWTFPFKKCCISLLWNIEVTCWSVVNIWALSVNYCIHKNSVSSLFRCLVIKERTKSGFSPSTFSNLLLLLLSTLVGLVLIKPLLYPHGTFNIFSRHWVSIMIKRTKGWTKSKIWIQKKKTKVNSVIVNILLGLPILVETKW